MNQKMNTVVAGWQELSGKVLPPTCGAVQRRESERMFYAGAAHMYFMIVENIMLDDKLDEHIIESRLQSYNDELKIFFDSQLTKKPTGDANG